MTISKKFIKINLNTQGEYTVEEILDIYKNFIEKYAWNYYKYIHAKFEMHMSYVDVEDLKQLVRIAIIKTYNKYSIDFNKDENYENDTIGFFPFMKTNVDGEIKRFIRDTLKVRRKGYNIHEIAVCSVDQSIPNSKGEKEMNLAEVIEDEKSIKDFKLLELKMEIENYLLCLDEKAKNIIYDHFFRNMSQHQIGEKYGTSQAQISRIIKRSLSKMKTIVESKNSPKRLLKTESKKKKIVTKKTIHNNKEEIIMIKGKIDTRHALEYFENHIKEERPLDEIMELYCNTFGISKSELNYALHTTCSSSFNKIVDEYIKFEDDYEEVKVENIMPKQDKVSKIPYRQPAPCSDFTPINYTEPKTEKETESIKTNPLAGLNIIDLRIGLDSLEASISKETVTLRNLPEDVELTVEELKILRDDINKLIEIKESLSINTLK